MEKITYSTFTMLMQCEHCGGGLPLQGPMRTVRCTACQGDNRIEAERIATYLQDAAEGVSDIMDEIKFKHFRDGHPCPECGSPVDLTRIPVGVESSTPCEKCGAPIFSFPPPPWLKEQLPGLVQVYGAERDPADLPASGTPLAVGEEKTKAKPIVTACPQCNGSLSVTADSPRTMACTFCGASVFLPEELWRTLHPVKRVAPWSIAWEGYPLVRLEDIRREEREKVDAARKQQEREAGQKQQESKEQESMRKNRRNMIVGALIGSLAVVAILLLFYYFIFFAA